MTGAFRNLVSLRLAPPVPRIPSGPCRRARLPSRDLPTFAFKGRPPRERDFRPSQAPIRRSRLRTGGSGCDSWSQSLSAKQRTGRMKGVSRLRFSAVPGRVSRCGRNCFRCRQLQFTDAGWEALEAVAELLRILGIPHGGVSKRSPSPGSRAWCPGADSNHRHPDFQSGALPTELPGQSRA